MTTETRTMTMAEIAALPGMLGKVATAMVKRHGRYGYTTTDGRKVTIVLAR